MKRQLRAASLAVVMSTALACSPKTEAPAAPVEPAAPNCWESFDSVVSEKKGPEIALSEVRGCQPS